MSKHQLRRASLFAQIDKKYSVSSWYKHVRACSYACMCAGFSRKPWAYRYEMLKMTLRNGRGNVAHGL